MKDIITKTDINEFYEKLFDDKENYSFINNEKYVDVYNFGKSYEDTIAISKSDFNLSLIDLNNNLIIE